MPLLHVARTTPAFSGLGRLAGRHRRTPGRWGWGMSEWWIDPHPRRGIVTSHPDGYRWESGEAHLAVNCCGRIECIDKALAWIKSDTGREGAWIVDAGGRE